MSILFLDNNYNKIKIQKSIDVFIPNKKKIDFIILLKSLIDFSKNFFTQSLRYYYLENLCKKIKPKIIIGNQFNFNLFKLKKNFPHIKIYMYFSYLMSPSLQKKYVKKINFQSKVDNLFLPHKKLSLILKNKIKGNYIYSGFLKNNEIKLIYKKNHKYDLMIISEYRNNILKSKLMRINLALNNLSEIIQNNKLKVCIAFVSNREDKASKVQFNDEKIFFDKFNFKYSVTNLDSYSLSVQSKIIFSMNSNLGFELLSRGQKVIFLSNGQEIFLNKYYFIVKPHDLKKKFLKLLNMKESSFKKLFIAKKIIKFDQGNQIFKSQIKKDLKKL